MTTIPKHKTVLLPVTVPEGVWCWEGTPPFTLCSHFDNEGGHPRCMISRLLPGYPEIKYDEKTGGVRKPPECIQLQETSVKKRARKEVLTPPAGFDE